MSPYDLKIKEYLNETKINAEHLILNESCHSVEEAAKAVNAYKEEFVKNICMMDQNGNLIVAIVKGEDRASTSRVSKALNIARPRLATENEVLEGTGYPAGGVPSFGYRAEFLIDPRVTELTYVFTGGGSPNSLVKITVEDLLKVNKGIVVRIRK
ncbi:MULTISPECIES: aminoacyl-tRNA deacylase [Bacillus]|uniref:YbaK/prolyl-tRNA synthetase associated protein n=2 Tax=Bacillus cereus group TaxID=86661 RepID=E5AK26_BACCE|nr:MULTISPECIES: YbaK/EbsC family protein [Bacillus]EDX65366.1 YbaK/prolyl-tRNA synthetase associated region [Bacillus cereus NVH0597-99]MBS9806743.1 YbaK/EbsC family protein [Bacillus toyonensis]MED2798397.1 YbaK/EbsC family protein [Bacillus thuringiensis]MCC2327389.1 YbaK/EbsC family protein [Bacillus wiedmannii]MDF9614140.1 YbaK/EbsC family protein [Bacillus cereus]